MTYPLTTICMGYIERIPFFHFFPGMRTLSVGTYGCNLNCKYCMNSHLLNEPAFFFDLSAEQIADKAKRASAGMISFSANEPAVSFPYFLDIAQAAQEKSLLVGCSTNGLFSDTQMKDLIPAVSCANISLKGPDSTFYREVCRGGSIEKVMHTIRTLHEQGVHVEITTPYVPSMSQHDMMQIAEKISTVSRGIPWHIFRLLPEYEYTDMARTGISDMIALKNEAEKMLDFIYLENFANSIWVDTLCPRCKELVFKRVSTGGCGATLFDARVKDGACPRCGGVVLFSGRTSMESPEPGPRPDPRKGIIEVGGWKSVVDMGTCLPVELNRPVPLQKIISENPYPGDMTPTSDAWVTDMALAAIDAYTPDLAVVTYAQCAFTARHREDDETYRDFVGIAEKEIQRLITATGYDYLVIGLGDMVPTRGTINLEKHIHGIASADEGIACLYHTSQGDMEAVAMLEGVQAVHSRKAIQEMLGQKLDPDMYGEYFVLPKEGYRFLALSSVSRFSHRTDALDLEVPAYASISIPKHLSEIRGSVMNSVAQGRKVLLIILDGVGSRAFPFEKTPVGNTVGDIAYASSLHQYMVISTGEKIYPYFFAYPHWKSASRINPFSRHTPFLTDCLTTEVRSAGKLAVSIGNRSIMTHTAFPADLTIECHCASLHHYGTLEVIA